MDTPSAPAAPDPAATAAAQTASNKQTAQTQYELNATNQYSPQGSITYKQNGTWDDGTPRFDATTSLSPQEQSIYDTGTQTRQNLANIGSAQSSKIGTLLNTPYSLNTDIQNKIQGIQNTFLDPQWQRQGDALDTQLINKGIRPGSAQWQTAHTDFSNQRQKAYDQSYLDSYNTAQSSSLAERNQPINEITALLSGSQVSNPTAAQTPNVGVAPTDVIGANQQALNQQNVGYQGALQQNMGLMSGLFGLGSAGLGGWAYGGFKGSDIRLKTDISKVGQTDSGIPVYLYRYKDSPTFEMGVMAQDVEHIIPEAVRIRRDGMKMVHYGMIR